MNKKFDLKSFIFTFDKYEENYNLPNQNIFNFKYNKKIKKAFLENFNIYFLKELAYGKSKSKIISYKVGKIFFLFFIQFKAEIGNLLKFKINYFSSITNSKINDFFVYDSEIIENIDQELKKIQTSSMYEGNNNYLINFLFFTNSKLIENELELFYTNIFLYFLQTNILDVKILKLIKTKDKRIIILVDYLKKIDEFNFKVLLNNLILLIFKCIGKNIYKENFIFHFEKENLFSLYHKNMYKYLFKKLNKKNRKLISQNRFELIYLDYQNQINRILNIIDSILIIRPNKNKGIFEITLDLTTNYINYIYWTNYELAYEIFTKILRESYKLFSNPKNEIKLIVINSPIWFIYFMKDKELFVKKTLFNFNIDNINYFSNKNDYQLSLLLDLNQTKKYNTSIEYDFIDILDNFEKYYFRYLIIRKDLLNLSSNFLHIQKIKLLKEKNKELNKKILYL